MPPLTVRTGESPCPDSAGASAATQSRAAHAKTRCIYDLVPRIWSPPDEPTHHEHGIVAAERQGRGQPDRDRRLPRVIRDQIDVTLGIALANVNRRRHDAALDCQCECGRLNRTRGGETVADHRLD